MSGADTAIEPAEISASLPVAVPGRTTTRIMKGAGALSLTAAVNIVGQIVFVPVALSIWGTDAYGEWLVLTGLITFLSFTDLGIQSFVTNCMCGSYVRNERDVLQQQLHSALRLQIPLAGFVLSAIAVVFALFPVAALLGLHTVTSSTLFLTVLLLAGELLMGIPMGVIAGVYRATGYLPRGAIIGTIRQAGMFVVTLGLLALTPNFAIIAAGRFLVSGLVIVAILLDLRRLHPWLSAYPNSGSWAQGFRMVGPGLLFVAIPILQYASIQGIITLLQRFHAGSDVSWFSTHRTAVNFAAMLSGLLTVAVTPEFTALYALEKRDALLRLYRGLQRVNFWLVATALLGMLPFLPFVYPRWTAGRLNLNWALLAFLMSRMILWAWWNSSLILLSAINRVRPVAIALAISTTITLALAVSLVPRWGVYGAAAAWTLGDLLAAGWLIPSLASRHIGVSVWSELKAFCQAALPVLLSAAFGLLLWSRSSSGVYRFALVLPVTLLFGAMLLWRSTEPTERDILRRLLVKVLPAGWRPHKPDWREA
jgi:O-antigen/teichoic acid export membrane protein